MSCGYTCAFRWMSCGSRLRSATCAAFVLLFLLLQSTAAFAGQITLTWDPNTESNLSGYKLKIGNASGVYQTIVDVGNTTAYTATGLQDARVYYFVLTAYNTSGAESGNSSEASGAVPDATAPSVSLTAPAAGSSQSGTTTVTASATDSGGVVGVRFLIDGASLGVEDMTAPYSVSWNTTTVSDGSHTLSASARDAAGNTTISSARTVTVSNTAPDTTAPVISAMAASAITVSGATLSWTTNETSDSQVQYGVTIGYGGTSPLNGSLVTAHTVTLGGLTGATLYHYRVLSRDGAGNLATSGDSTFSTSAS